MHIWCDLNCLWLSKSFWLEMSQGTLQTFPESCPCLWQLLGHLLRAEKCFWNMIFPMIYLQGTSVFLCWQREAALSCLPLSVPLSCTGKQVENKYRLVSFFVSVKRGKKEEPFSSSMEVSFHYNFNEMSNYCLGWDSEKEFLFGGCSCNYRGSDIFCPR